MGNLCTCLSNEKDDSSVGTEKSKEAQSERSLAIAAAEQELKKGHQHTFYDRYSVGKLIGHGAFAKVSSCTHLTTKQQYAVKVVTKNYDEMHKQRTEVVKEIAIMRMLQDHPNVVRLFDVYEDHTHYLLVLELCTGGELFDQIIAKGHFSERDAAEKMRCLLDFIGFAHGKGIMHRDLKPENILLSSKEPDAQIRVIDFGTSEFCEEGQRLHQKFGTPYYVAPEVLHRDYCKAADIWSLGVIMYILLCGYPPFGGKADAKILQKVESGTYSFACKGWDQVTEAAKDMINHMLVKDEATRWGAEQLLEHPWFEVALTSPAAALGLHMVKRLQVFAGMNRMKRLALTILARTLTDTDVRRLRDLFTAMDLNKDGRIDAVDLHDALDKVGAAVDDDELRDLFHASVTDDSGTIDYEQFIAAMLDSNRVARRKDAVRTSFEQLDLDGDGFITVEDLCRLLPNSRSRRSIDLARSMVEEVDKNHDGRVDYQEFSEMMNTPEPNVSSSVHLVQHGTSSRRNSSTYGGEASRPGSLLKGGSGVASSFGSGASHVVSAASASGAANGDHAIAAAAAIAASPEPAAGAAEGGASSQEGSALQQPVPLAGGGLVPVA